MIVRTKIDRIFSLLQMLGLEERLVDYKNTKNILDMFNCDFTKANQKLIKKERILLNI